MKKILATLMAVTMMLSMLGSCAPKEPTPNTPGNSSANSSSAASSSAAQSGEPAGIPRTITLADGTVYPKGTVTFIAPFAAGGGVDLGIRLFTKYAQNYTDAALVVENITGGSGLVGIQTGMGRDTNGYTMWHIDTGTQYVTTSNSSCPFSVLDEMSMVGQLVADDRVWVMAPDEDRFSNAEEFFAYVKDHSDEVSVACSGAATISGCSTIYLEQAAGVKLNLISFGGAADAKAAFLGGHCDIMAAGVSEAYPMLQEGQCKVICSMTDERIDIEGFRDAPTCQELGYDMTSASTNRGLAISNKVDPAIVEWWSNIMAEVTSDPDFLAEAASMSLVINYRNSAELTELAKEQFDLWYEIKEDAGL